MINNHLVADYRRLLKKQSETEWIRKGEHLALELFHDTARRVPAYKKFLKEYGVDPAAIRSIEDFSSLPLMTKENYLRVYPLTELIPDGDISRMRMISTSSGSTGPPFFWPRTEDNEREAELIHELFLLEFYNIDTKRTLFINTFALGMWVAGTTTYESLRRIAERHNVTIVTPGIDIDQVLNTVLSIGHFFEQIIIAGYPPFVKDVIDAGNLRAVPWASLHPRFLFAAESFSETWREHIHTVAGVRDPLAGSLNIYGTADALIVAHETPLSILIRKEVTRHPDVHTRLFGVDLRVPTLAQYNPTSRYFEELSDTKLIFTSGSGIPLIRYDIGDTGHILHRDDIAREFHRSGIDLGDTIRRAGLNDHSWNLPFVMIYGRDRMTASLYGLKIYPEHIRGAMESSVAAQIVTGRFVMATKTDEAHDQFLEIHVELLPGVEMNEAVLETLGRFTLEHLKTVNGEFKRLHEAIGPRAVPRIICYSYNTSELFNRQGKQQWKK